MLGNLTKTMMFLVTLTAILSQTAQSRAGSNVRFVSPAIVPKELAQENVIAEWYFYHKVSPSGVDLTIFMHFVKKGALYQVKGLEIYNTGDQLVNTYKGSYSPSKGTFSGYYTRHGDSKSQSPASGYIGANGQIFIIDNTPEKLVPAKIDSNGKLIPITDNGMLPTEIPSSFEIDKPSPPKPGTSNPDKTGGSRGSLPSGNSPLDTKNVLNVAPRKSGPVWVSDGGVADPQHVSSPRTTLALNSMRVNYETTSYDNSGPLIKFNGTSDFGSPPAEIRVGDTFTLKMNVNVTASNPWLRTDPSFQCWYESYGIGQESDNGDGKGLRSGVLRGGGRMAATPGQQYPTPVFNSCTYRFKMGPSTAKTLAIVQESNMGRVALFTYTLQPGTTANANPAIAGNGKAELHGITNPKGVSWVYPDGSIHKYVYGGLTTLTAGTKLVVGPGSEVVIEAPNGEYVHIKSNSSAAIVNGKLVVNKIK